MTSYKILLFFGVLSFILVPNQLQGESIALSFCYPVGPIIKVAPPGSSAIDDANALWAECPVQPQFFVPPDTYYYNAQDFLQHNSVAEGFHLGDDWNGVVNGQAGKHDYGLPVYAIAEGTVVFADDLGDGQADSWGKVLVIRHRLEDGIDVYALYAHLAYFSVPLLCHSSSSTECHVDQGQQVGAIGDGNGFYTEEMGNGSAHLHFELRKQFPEHIPGPGYVQDDNDPFIGENYLSPTDFIEAHRSGFCVASSTEGSTYLELNSGCSSPGPPEVTTNSASGVTQQTATLNLSVNPHDAETTVWFGWDDDPSISFLTTSHLIDRKNSSVPVSITLGGLNCGTTYYYQAHAENRFGTDTGTALVFATDSCSSGGFHSEELLVDGGFEDEGGGGWTVSGDFHADDRFANAHSGSGYAYLSNSDGTRGNNLFGFLMQEFDVPANASDADLSFWFSITSDETASFTEYDTLDVVIWDWTNQQPEFAYTLSNLDENGTSYDRLSYDLSHLIGRTVRVYFTGQTDESFPTVFRLDDISVQAVLPDVITDKPSVNTLATDQVTSFSARLRMSINPNGSPTEVWWALEANDSTPNSETPHFSIGSGTNTDTVTYTATGLQCDVTYFTEAHATNNEGTAEGNVLAFQTPQCPGSPPIADTDPADFITESGARLLGEVHSNNEPTEAWFEWGETSSLGVATARMQILAENHFVDISQAISGLECSSVYYYQAAAENAYGASRGNLHSLTSSACSNCGTDSLTISSIVIEGLSSYRACQSISIGPSVQVENGGRLELQAPRIVFKDGFVVQEGGELLAGADQP